jgi:hypothetical protein
MMIRRNSCSKEVLSIFLEENHVSKLFQELPQRSQTSLHSAAVKLAANGYLHRTKVGWYVITTLGKKALAALKPFDTRKLFEEKMKTGYPVFPLTYKDGNYVCDNTQHMWNGWQLGRQSK